MPIDWDRLVIGPTVEIFGEGNRSAGGGRKPIRYHTPVGSFDIDGVFDEEYLNLTPLGRGSDGAELLSLGAPGAISTTMPVLGVQLSQFEIPPEQGDTLEIRGQAFAVKEVRPDGHGWAKLLLNED